MVVLHFPLLSRLARFCANDGFSATIRAVFMLFSLILTMFHHELLSSTVPGFPISENKWQVDVRLKSIVNVKILSGSVFTTLNNKLNKYLNYGCGVYKTQDIYKYRKRPKKNKRNQKLKCKLLFLTYWNECCFKKKGVNFFFWLMNKNN